MPARKTQEQVIDEFKKVHGDKYDYSKVEYKDTHNKVCIICHEKDENGIEHGEFWQEPNSHLSGRGCRKCAYINFNNPLKIDTQKCIELSIKKHGNRYDYVKTVCSKSSDIIIVTCKKHGDFKIKASSHYRGVGCPYCTDGHSKIDFDIFYKKQYDKFCGKYSFDEKDFISYDKEIKIYCNDCKIWFKKTPKDFLHSNTGCCPRCQNNTPYDNEKFIEKCKKKQSVTYSYKKTKFNGLNNNVIITCEKHGDIYITASNLLYYDSEKCPECKRIKQQNKLIELSKLKYKNRFDYSNVIYKKRVDKVKIHCNICNTDFYINFTNHLAGNGGCPNCSNGFKYTKDVFLEKANIIHHNKYSYEKSKYIDCHTKIIITCPYHGDFEQTPASHLAGTGCPICGIGMLKSFKLSLLEEIDLESMDAHQLLELIKMGNLPKEFKTLIFSKPKSQKRKDDVKKLKEKYSDETKSEEETNKEIEEQIQKEEKKFEENNNNEQEDFALPELTEIQDVIDSTKYFDIDKLGISHGEGEKFLINSSLHKLWNSALNFGDSFINQYKSDTNSGKWFNCIRDMFFDEYNKVNSIVVDENCKFPYKPNLMQKLMVYRMQENNYYGNWSDAGAGKSFARELASRAINAHVSLYIVPNAVKDTTGKSIIEAYPDSNVIFIENIDDIVKLDETKYNYMIINYEKFQQEYTMDWINKLIETNKIDFICLDEIQNVKVRDTQDISTRNTMIRTLIENEKQINSDVKLLALSATPIINNLTEVRMLMELLTGNEYKEIGNRNTIENIHEAYKALLLNGFRFIPKYDININTSFIRINGVELTDKLKNISNSDILKIEQLLACLKIKECVKHGLIKDKIIIYTHYVDGIVPMLRNEIESLGLKVDCYTGNETEKQRKDIIDNFINGNLDVLIGSQPISTGVDGLQKVCHNMIIISAPWTNAEYHQLIKRIYRQGSLFKDVDVIIPKLYIDKWSWDERRIEIIEHKKTLGEAVLDGSFNFKKYDEESFRTKLLRKAIESLKQGIEDKDVIRKKIEIEEIDIVKVKRSESYVNEIHRVANTSKHENISKNVYGNDKNKFNEYHKHRQEAIKSWVENPINYVADIINNRNEESYHDIIDMGCGLNQLKDLIKNGDKRVVGVDFYSDDKNVIQSDMCDLNKYVANESKDICVFCLSLWGTNYEDCIKEANRIMKHGGILIIVEPLSKFGENEHYNTIDDFSAKIEKYGFEVLGRKTERNNFVYFMFHKI